MSTMMMTMDFFVCLNIKARLLSPSGILHWSLHIIICVICVDVSPSRQYIACKRRKSIIERENASAAAVEQ
jgi:hypothetical protein